MEEATGGVAGGCRRGRIAGSAGGAATGMPPVVPNDSLDRAPSGRGFAVDRTDDRPVGCRAGSTVRDSLAAGARRVAGNPRRGSSGDGNCAGGTPESDEGAESVILSFWDEELKTVSKIAVRGRILTLVLL